MSEENRKIEIEIKGYLGSQTTHWQGGAVGIFLPVGVAEKLGLKKVKGAFITDSGKKKQLLFYETDKGILIKVVDDKTDKRLREIIEKGESLLGHPTTQDELNDLIEALKKKD
jgi:hypothetical protein